MLVANRGGEAEGKKTRVRRGQHGSMGDEDVLCGLGEIWRTDSEGSSF